MSFAIVPSSSELSDLLEVVKQAIQARTCGHIRGLRVHLNEGCLVVSGRTSTYYNKQLATHAIRDTVDDMSVQNEVEVCATESSHKRRP